MSFLSRLFGTQADPREQWRPLWHRVVEEARDPDWYRMCGVADTVEGRFDMVTLALSLALLRMEKDADLAPHTALLTELFVEDMEGQLREAGIGDPTVGKKIGTLMSTMGGRLGAYRKALADEDRAALADAVRRNVTMAQEDEAEALAERMIRLDKRLSRTSVDQLRKGEFAV
ncbi:ubiquinol-cytochrome C chaperone family protein [Qipengyuania gaetbuli]|uniref:ubiquinol-cytochrome C chaperone family protein n=1 Tax=Qipengyuania gaetbuli TaxID=266952 RepID=UPI001C997B5C|nr:ubiquinol-cytochrome C chaperone family protein [Qipengyuania gaetbuli]MBY6015066.1 ubiquinol-cytochrome C chaperone family protein [Qipengyuania gaetbuli]